MKSISWPTVIVAVLVLMFVVPMVMKFMGKSA